MLRSEAVRPDQNTLIYNEVHPDSNELAVARLILWWQGQLLFIQRSLISKNYPGYFEFPGGKVDPGFTAYEQLLREMNEEIGQTFPVDPQARFEHRYRMSRAQNSLHGRVIHTTLFAHTLPPEFDPQTINLRNQEKREHDSFVFLHPQDAILRHNNNQGLRLHRATSYVLPVLAAEAQKAGWLAPTRRVTR